MGVILLKRYLSLLIVFTLLIFTACGRNGVSEQGQTTVLSPAGSLTTTTTTDSSNTPESSASAEPDADSSSSPDKSTSKEPSSNQSTITAPITTTPAVSSSEMRGAWASYIELNSLFQKCSTASAAKSAINGMLDTLEDFSVNTLYFHVRANSDAYYKSAYFKPAAAVAELINAGFDPLSYTVQAAHARGIAVHAWINPYRVGSNAAYLVSDVPTFTDSAKRYYYVPTSTAARKLILNGVRELVNNYAIDGVQYDDYFYPAGVVTASAASFETADYTAYKNGGGTLSVANWRRAAVDTLVADTHTITKAKGLVFGISPSADYNKTYNQMYADPKKWMSQSGYVDYICPQIYYGFNNSTSAFDDMTDQWLSYPRHSSVKLYVGLATYKAGMNEDTYAGAGKYEWANNNDILKRSVLYLRSKKITGFAFYSYSYLKPTAVSGINVSVAKKEMQNLLTVL